MRHDGLDRLLTAWLPAQRWFAGGGSQVSDIEIVSDVELAGGDPELRHLIADVWLGPQKDTYQVLVGIATIVPPELGGAVIGSLPDGSTAYDGARDPRLTPVLLDSIAAGRVAGHIRFAAEPGAAIDAAMTGRTLPALASNTSVVFGDKAILKLLRRPSPGSHPDLEIPGALARAGSSLVAAPLGWIEATSGEADAGGRRSAAEGEPGTGQSMVLGILAEFFPHATDGWALATAAMHDAQPDFSSHALTLGEATARLHAEMAAAFGTRELRRHELPAMADAMAGDLARAIGVVPQLGQYEAGIMSCYAGLAALTSPVIAQRIHGDYHLAQVLSTDGGWVVLDFEGEPSVPLEQRRAFAPAMRDVAGMLRSFDYAARHQALQRPDDPHLASIAADWVSRCQEAFCDGYAKVCGTDPRGTGPLLRAFTYSKAVYEAFYEVRHRPDWLPIPLGALAEAST
jgi:maltokinase